jgi:hypothetical protein
VGRLVPTLSHGTAWPYEAVGAGFGVLGIVFIWPGVATIAVVVAGR